MYRSHVLAGLSYCAVLSDFYVYINPVVLLSLTSNLEPLGDPGVWTDRKTTARCKCGRVLRALGESGGREFDLH